MGSTFQEWKVDFLFLETSSLNVLETHIRKLKTALAPLHLTFEKEEGEIEIVKGSSKIKINIISTEHSSSPEKGVLCVPLDCLVSQPEKVGAIIQSKLGLNKRAFARNCEVKKLNKEEAKQFLEAYHLMNSTQSAFNYGLYHKGELLAVASFSKGRKMRRLQNDLRSFELIRFCCKKGHTITGGLSKLLKHFVNEKKAGDIMTYVDQQWSEGDSFVKAGFKRAEKTEPKTFLIDKKTFERKQVPHDWDASDSKQFFLLRDCGNLKLIYTPLAKH